MTSRINLALLFFALLFFIIPPVCADGLSATISSITDNSVIPEESKKLKNPKLVFNAYIPGTGRVRIKLNKVKKNEVVATFTDSLENTVIDRTPLKLMRGNVDMKSKQSKAAASVFYIGKDPHLFISFLGINPKTGRSQLNKLKINLTNQKVRLFRVRRMKKHSHEMDSIIAPFVTKTIKNLNKRVLTTLKEIDLNIDADFHWYSIFGTNSNAVLSSYLNEAEVIYENDLKLTFNIVRQNVYTSTSFGTSDAIDRLCNYQYFVTGESFLSGDSRCNITSLQGPQSFFGTADAYHLFTGEDLAGSTIGIAFLGTICTSEGDAVGLSQLTSSAVTPVTFAHELGHKLSAIHDNSSGWNGYTEASCPETSTPNIMGAVVSSSPPESFSDCSVNLIRSFVNNFGSCLNTVSKNIDNSDTSPVPDPTPDPSSPDYDYMTAKAIVKKRGGFIVKVNLPENALLSEVSSCTLKVLFSKKVGNLDDTRIYSETAFTDMEMIFKGKVKYQLLPKGNGKYPTGYVRADLICNGELASQSNVASFSAAKVQVGSAIKVNKWLKKANQALF